MEEAKTGPKDVFLHLLSIIALYVSAGSFIALIFQYINLLIPDPVSSTIYSVRAAQSAIRFSLASFVVVFPVYIWSVWFLGKSYKSSPEKLNLRIRWWLLNFTIFLAAIVIIGDLVVLIFNLLQGELAVRFLLKVLAVLLVAAAILGFYFSELKRRATYDSRMFAYPAIVVFFIAVIAGFFLAGSPMEERARRFDDIRVGHLFAIQEEIKFFWRAKQRLPQNIDELKNELRGFIPPVDPETGQAYEYNKKGEKNFELCAAFSRESLDENAMVKFRPYGDAGDQIWNHSAGRVCFERTIDPDLLPPLKEIK